jgi:hypothetical protein
MKRSTPSFVAFFWPLAEVASIVDERGELIGPWVFLGPEYRNADDAIVGVAANTHARYALHPQLVLLVVAVYPELTGETILVAELREALDTEQLAARLHRLQQAAARNTARLPNRGAPREARPREEIREALDAAGLTRKEVCAPAERAAPDRTKPAARVAIAPVSAAAVEADTRRADPTLTEDEISLIVARRLMYPQHEIALLRLADGSPAILRGVSLERAALAQSDRPEMRGAQLVAIWPALAPKGQTPEALEALQARLRVAGVEVDAVERASLYVDHKQRAVQLGAATSLVVPSAGGIKRYAARYALVPFDAVITSHDANTFREDARYPAAMQERDYTERAEQAKVIRQVQSFSPELVLNSNPDATNGPPIIAPEGFVLGGNSRVMTIKRARDAYARAVGPAIAAHCGIFGLRGAANERDHMLVRILLDEYDPATISQELNRVPTQQIGAAAGAVSLAARLPEDLLSMLLDSDAAETGTLRAALRANENAVIAALVAADVITPQERPRWVTKQNNLTDEAITQIEKGIAGALVADKVLLARIEDKRALFSLLLAIAPAIVLLERLDPAGERGFNIAPSMRAALTLAPRLLELRPHERAEYFLTQGLIEDAQIDAVVNDPVAVEALLWLLAATPRKASNQIRDYLARARQSADPNQAMLFAPLDPVELRRQSLGWATPAEQAADGGALARLSGRRLVNPCSCQHARVLHIGAATPAQAAQAARELGLTHAPRDAWAARRVGVLPMQNGAVALVEPLHRVPNGAGALIVPLARLVLALGWLKGGLNNPTPRNARRQNGRPCFVSRVARLIVGTWWALGAAEAIQKARSGAGTTT